MNDFHKIYSNFQWHAELNSEFQVTFNKVSLKMEEMYN